MSGTGCCRVAEIRSIAENSPGRSDPLNGGATTLIEGGLSSRRRLGGWGRGRGVGGGRWGRGFVGSGVGSGRRKGSMGSWRGAPRGGGGSEVGGRCESCGSRFRQGGAMCMEGWSFFFVSEHRRERNSEREEERSRHWRYLSALVRAGVGGGRPRRDCLLSNSSEVSMWGALPPGRYRTCSQLWMLCFQRGVSLCRIVCVGGYGWGSRRVPLSSTKGWVAAVRSMDIWHPSHMSGDPVGIRLLDSRMAATLPMV